MIANITKTLYAKHMIGLSEIKEANVNLMNIGRSYRTALFRPRQGVERTAS